MKGFELRKPDIKFILVRLIASGEILLEQDEVLDDIVDKLFDIQNNTEDKEMLEVFKEYDSFAQMLYDVSILGSLVNN